MGGLPANLEPPFRRALELVLTLTLAQFAAYLARGAATRRTFFRPPSGPARKAKGVGALVVHVLSLLRSTRCWGR